MNNPIMIYTGAINTNFSLLSFLFLVPIAAVIYLDIMLVHWGIRKEGRAKVLAIILSFIVSLAGIGWGLAGVFTDFSLVALFVAGGGGIMFLFSLRFIGTDKDDLKHGR
jgi:hypothetical protein